MKKCAYCGKELEKTQQNNIYCSLKCSNDAKKDQKITLWKSGEWDGSRGKGQLSTTIRNYLLSKNNYQCQECGWGKINHTTLLCPLEIHHIDGNCLNNVEENLKVLCPNCHSLTNNYKSLNKNSQYTNRTVSRKNYCIDCHKEIGQTSLRCRECNDKIKIIPLEEMSLTREELKQLIRTTPFTRIGEIYGVTDNAIRKWCDKFGLPRKVSEIKKYSDEEWEKI